MRTVKLLIIAVLLAIFGSEAVAAKTSREDWKDEKRDRVVPVKIYVPDDLKEKAPVVIFSHGLGGSRDNYTSTANYWSSHGYIVIMLQHPGSDSSVWQNSKLGVANLVTAANLENYILRVQDVIFALDQLEKLSAQQDHLLHDKVNLDEIAMAGHSFGSYTTLAVAGQIKKMGNREFSYGDKRIKCAIAMSPSPGENQTEETFSKIKIPVFHLTGTKDVSAIQQIDPVQRQQPYKLTKATDQYLLVLKDGDHMMFSGRGPMAKKYGETILKSTTAFLDAYLKKDKDAAAYLKEKFKDEVGVNGTFEFK